MKEKLTLRQSQAHIIQAYNTVTFLNQFFAENPNEKIGKKEFMELQKVVWDKVKEELDLKKRFSK